MFDGGVSGGGPCIDDRSSPLEHGTHPSELTVLGVDAHDPRLHTELHRYVPGDADALYLLAIPPTELAVDDVIRAGLYNPPATGAALVLRGWRSRAVPSLQSAAAVSDVGANRDLPVHELSVGGFAQIPRQRPPWTVSAWALTALVVFTAVALLVSFGVPSVVLAMIVAPLVVSFVLAHAGAHLRIRDAAILSAVRTRAASDHIDHPVVVVPERHAHGIADDAKDEFIEATARTVSTDLTADESLY